MNDYKMAIVFGMLCYAIICASTVAGQGSICVNDCTNKPNGDYQSCQGCNVYVTCSNGLIHDNRPCPADLVWDDTLKRCEWYSSTCHGGCGENEEFYIGNCLCIPGYKLEHGKCVLECADNNVRGDTFIEYPNMEVTCRYFVRFSTINIQECKDHCLANPNCRSLVYYGQARVCYHSPCDPIRDPVFGSHVVSGFSFRRNVPFTTLFVRNCIMPSK